MTMRMEIKGWGFYFLSSVSEITLENKPFRYKAFTLKMDKLPNTCKLESISPMAKIKILMFSIA